MNTSKKDIVTVKDWHSDCRDSVGVCFQPRCRHICETIVVKNVAQKQRVLEAEAVHCHLLRNRIVDFFKRDSSGRLFDTFRSSGCSDIPTAAFLLNAKSHLGSTSGIDNDFGKLVEKTVNVELGR